MEMLMNYMGVKNTGNWVKSYCLVFILCVFHLVSGCTLLRSFIQFMVIEFKLDFGDPFI